MKIGELAERSGVTRDTIRFYERNGLIVSTPGNSDTNNYRDYPEESLFRLGFLTKAREAGMSIADLKDIANAMEGSCDKDMAKEVFRAKIAELQDRENQIRSVISFLQTDLETL